MTKLKFIQTKQKKRKQEEKAEQNRAITMTTQCNNNNNDQQILTNLNIQQSSQSIDYVNTKQQFQLHTLLTEQRHEKTFNLSQTIKHDTSEGLRQLLSVDEDISSMFENLVNDKARLKLLICMQEAVEKAIKSQ